jgi:hypothetical protein
MAAAAGTIANAGLFARHEAVNDSARAIPSSEAAWQRDQMSVDEFIFWSILGTTGALMLLLAIRGIVSLTRGTSVPGQNAAAAGTEAEPSMTSVTAPGTERDDLESSQQTDVLLAPCIRAPPSAHVNAIVTALQREGLTGPVSVAEIELRYSDICQANGFEELGQQQLARAMERALPRARKRFGGEKVHCYIVPTRGHKSRPVEPEWRNEKRAWGRKSIVIDSSERFRQRRRGPH